MRVLDIAPGSVVLTRDRKLRLSSSVLGDVVLSRRRGLRVRSVALNDTSAAPLERAGAPADQEQVVVVADRQVRLKAVCAGAVLVHRDAHLRVRRVTEDTILVDRGESHVRKIVPDAILVDRGESHVRKIVPDGAVVVSSAPVGAARVGHELQVVGPVELFSRSGRLRRDKVLSDWLLREHLRDLIRRYRVNCILDVGANRGQFAASLRAIGYRGRIISFEPVPEIHTQLAAQAEGDDLWDVHQLALGRQNATLELHVVPGTLTSALPASEFGAARYAQLRDAVQVQEVPVRRLDDVLPELLPPGADPARILLKVDTQGYDLEVFGGLGEAVDQVVALQSEVALLTIYDKMPRLPEALAVYEAAGFEVSGMYPVTREKRTGRVLEYDCVMVRAEALD